MTRDLNRRKIRVEGPQCIGCESSRLHVEIRAFLDKLRILRNLFW